MSNENAYFDVCVLCALAKEAKAFRDVVLQQYPQASFEQEFSKDNRAYLSTTIGNNRGESLKLLLSWLPRYGPLETAWHLQSLLREFNPRFVAMTGICAGEKPRVKLGDLVIAERAFMADTGKFKIEDGQELHEYDTYTAASARDVLQFARMFDLSSDLMKTLPLPSGIQSLSPDYHIAPMASSNAVREDNPFNEVKVPVRSTIAIDMEGAAFYQTVEQFPGIRSLLVKGISDYADGSKNDTYQIYASQLSALYMLTFIREYVRFDLMPRLHKEAVPVEGKPAALPLSIPSRRDEHIPVPASGPLKVFISYASKDERAREELDSHLALLRRQGKITCQYSRNIDVGMQIKAENEQHMNESQLVLLLVSPHYSASRVYDSEVMQACSLYEAGLARVVPVLLSPMTGWEEEFFGKLQPLPKNRKPVSAWSSRDQAFYEVAQEIRKVVEQLSEKRS